MYQIIYKLFTNLIPNDWKHLLLENSRKPFLKGYGNNKRTRKVKDYQKLSNKETYFILPNDSNKYSKPVMKAFHDEWYDAINELLTLIVILRLASTS